MTDNRVRLNLTVAPEVRQRLERLLDTTESESLTEVVRRALTLYEFALAETQSGELVIRKPDGAEVRVVVL